MTRLTVPDEYTKFVENGGTLSQAQRFRIVQLSWTTLTDLCRHAAKDIKRGAHYTLRPFHHLPEVQRDHILYELADSTVKATIEEEFGCSFMSFSLGILIAAAKPFATTPHHAITSHVDFSLDATREQVPQVVEKIERLARQLCAQRRIERETLQEAPTEERRATWRIVANDLRRREVEKHLHVRIACEGLQLFVGAESSVNELQALLSFESRIRENQQPASTPEAQHADL